MLAELLQSIRSWSAYTKSPQALNANKYGDVYVSDGLPKYYGLVDSGIVYTAYVGAAPADLAAANLSLVAATFQGLPAILNPTGSNVNLVLLEAGFGAQATGAAAVNEGIPVYQITTPSTPASTTSPSAAVTNNKTLVQSATGGQKAIAALNTAFAGNGSTWLIKRPFIPSGGGTGPRVVAPTASININTMAKEILDGSIFVPPGSAIGLGVLSAGTTMKATGYLTWAEVPNT